MENCVFCKIRDKEVPADILFQDEDVMVFRDVSPQAPFHVLIVPKKHIARLTDPAAIDGGLLVAVFAAMQKLVIEHGLEKGFRVVGNCGDEGGQSVDHIHFHLLGKRRLSWPPG